MGFISNLFSSKETEKSIVDSVIASGDALVLTNEERIEYNQRKQELILRGAEIKTEMLSKYEPYKLVQRILALMTFIPFIVFLCAAFYFRISGNNEMADAIYNDINENFLTLVMMIMSFYYAGSVISNIRGK